MDISKSSSVQPEMKRDKGHLEIYGTEGYTGHGPWRRDQSVGTDYSFYQPYATSSTLASDPPADWNPPGYN